MDKNLKDQTLDKITKSESIQIIIDENTGVDGLASGLALALSLEKLNKSVSISAKEPTVEEAQTLYAVDHIGGSKGKENLVVVIGNAVKKVDHVSHFLDKDKLKIVIHPLASSEQINEKEISFEHESSKPDVIFSIGSKVNTPMDHEQKNSSEPWHINIDAGYLKQQFAHLHVSNENAASISEITTQLFQELALPIDEDISYNLYTGIKKATDNFSPNLAKPSSFQSAAWLIKFGPGKASFSESKAKPAISQSKLEPQVAYDDEKFQTPLENVEREKIAKEDWMKPPKIYKGSKSFDSEY